MGYTNPSIEQIRTWAYSSSGWPIHEWDLFLSWTGKMDLFIELATDHRCPQRRFFLHVLYYTVGTAFGVKRKDEARARIAAYADIGRGNGHGDIKTWVANVDALRRGRLAYRYEDWRGGALAGYDFSDPTEPA